MSLPILTPDDFTGVLAISQNSFKADKIAEYITTYESKYLRELLSEQAYRDIRDQSPLDQKYIDLIDGVDWVDDDGDQRNSRGLKEQLKYFIWFHWVKDNWSNTIVGNVQNKNENSNALSGGANAQVAYMRYNEGITIWSCDVLPFIYEFEDLNKVITGFVDNGGGAYTINNSDSKYLVDGDTVQIGADSYVVSSVVDDTSFDITAASAGLSFSGQFSYEPFDDYNKPNILASWL